MSDDAFNKYSLYPSDGQVEDLRKNHGLHPANKAAWKHNLLELLSSMEDEEMTPNEQKLNAVLWGLFESDLL